MVVSILDILEESHLEAGIELLKAAVRNHPLEQPLVLADAHQQQAHQLDIDGLQAELPGAGVWLLIHIAPVVEVGTEGAGLTVGVVQPPQPPLIV